MTSSDIPTPQPGAVFRATQRRQLALLLDSLKSVHVSEAEQRSLTWLAGWEAHTVRNIAAVIA